MQLKDFQNGLKYRVIKYNLSQIWNLGQEQVSKVNSGLQRRILNQITHYISMLRINLISSMLKLRLMQLLLVEDIKILPDLTKLKDFLNQLLKKYLPGIPFLAWLRDLAQRSHK
ncbi:MAG: hypothetical protein CMF72_19780 [Mameliella sp.]|nr:hypothetical protein [Mameliella sp.]